MIHNNIKKKIENCLKFGGWWLLRRSQQYFSLICRLDKIEVQTIRKFSVKKIFNDVKDYNDTIEVEKSFIARWIVRGHGTWIFVKVDNKDFLISFMLSCFCHANNSSRGLEIHILYKQNRIKLEAVG